MRVDLRNGEIVNLCEECYFGFIGIGSRRIGPSPPNSTCKGCGAMLGIILLKMKKEKE